MLVEDPLPWEPGEEVPGEPGEELDEEGLEEGELEPGLEGELELGLEGELGLDGELGLEGELLGEGMLGEGRPEEGVLGELGGGELLLEEQPARTIVIAAIKVMQRAEEFIKLPPGITSEPAGQAPAGRPG